MFVDGAFVGDIDRELAEATGRILGEEGFISVIVVIDSVSGKVASETEIHARGFAENDATFDEIEPIIDALDLAVREGQHTDAVPAPADGAPDRRTLGQPQTHRRRPMIIPVVIEA